MLLFTEFIKRAKGTTAPAQLRQANVTFEEAFKAVSSYRADMNLQENALNFCADSLVPHRISCTSLSEGAIQFLTNNNIRDIGTHAALRDGIKACELSLEHAKQALTALGNMSRRHNGLMEPGPAGEIKIHAVWPPSNPNGTQDVVQQILARRTAMVMAL